MPDALDLLDVDAPAVTPAPRLPPLLRALLVEMLDALEGRPRLPPGVTIYVDTGSGYRPVDVVRAPGWCADLRAALLRGDVAEARELLQGPGRYGFAPYANPQVTSVLARSFGGVLALAEAHARSLTPEALSPALLAALAEPPIPAASPSCALPGAPRAAVEQRPARRVIPSGRIRALTLWQPWAYAVSSLGKRIENRSRPPFASLMGEFVAVHAAARVDATAEREAAGWIRKTFEQECHIPVELPRGAVVALARVVGSVTASDDPWFVGPVGWQLADVIPLPVPVPCRGAQGGWTVPDEVAARVRGLAADAPMACSCCPRAERYSGFGSDGPRIFSCPKGCPCHD